MRAPKLGRASILAALAAGGIAELFSNRRLNRHLNPLSLDYLNNPDPDRLAADMLWLSEANQQLLTFDSPDYPSLLKRINDPPAALWLAGDPMLLWQPQLAIVGSRNPTRAGLENATAFAAYISRQGLLITSGMADGIDAAAHRAALQQRSTIAVLGTGVDLAYPACNRQLASEIRQAGLLVSEFPPGTKAKSSHFPSRNRIISGLSLGVLVVEAAHRSGTLITARLAAEQGREIFAIPGSIHNPLARGCHRLIRQGAKLVETADDVIQELSSVAAELALDLRKRLEVGADLEEDPGLNSVEPLSPDPVAPISTTNPVPADLPDDPEYQRLWASLSYDPQPQDKIISTSGLTAQAVSSMLLMLELRGMVDLLPGGNVIRK